MDLLISASSGLALVEQPHWTEPILFLFVAADETERETWISTAFAGSVMIGLVCCASSFCYRRLEHAGIWNGTIRPVVPAHAVYPRRVPAS